MTPAPGERLLRFVGDKISFQLRGANSGAPKNLRALLRTNLGRAAARRQEILSAHAGQAVVANSSWRDVPMQPTAEGWADRTAARRSRLLSSQGLSARRKKLAALA